MRTFMKILLGVLLSSTLLMAAEQKVVFDLTSGDEATINKHLIGNIEALGEYYRANGINFKVVVVISGDAYKYFVKELDNSPYKDNPQVTQAQKRMAPLLAKLNTKFGVEFDMCKAGMKARHIDKKVVYSYVKTDLNKSVALIKWQNAGYAYLPVH